MKKYIRKLYRRFSNFIQKITKGYSYYDLLSLDCTIADFILPRLKAYKEQNIGHPSCLSEEGWNVVLDKMIYSFEACSSKEAFSYKFDYSGTEYSEHRKRVEEGLKLFGKYFEALWI